jgi:hypothetical protein
VSAYRTDTDDPRITRAALIGSVTRLVWEVTAVPGHAAHRKEATAIVDRLLGGREEEGREG